MFVDIFKYIIQCMFNSTKPLNLVSPEILTEDNLSNADLVEHMIKTQVGVGFVNRHMGLPPNAFVSNDAVEFLINNTRMFNSRNEAVERLQVNTTFKMSNIL